MTVEEFVKELEVCIRDEFVAITEVNDNAIRIRFINGQLMSILVKSDT